MRQLFLLLALCLGLTARADVDQHALDRPIAELKLKDGTTITNVQLVSFSASAIMAKWDGGRGTLHYEDFPADWQPALASRRPGATPSRPAPAVAAPPAKPAAPKAITISGQAFIVTKGRDNVKLGSMTVSVYPKYEFDSYDISRKGRGKPESINSIPDYQLEEYSSWRTIPEPKSSTETDSEGRFTLRGRRISPRGV